MPDQNAAEEIPVLICAGLFCCPPDQLYALLMIRVLEFAYCHAMTIAPARHGCTFALAIRYCPQQRRDYPADDVFMDVK